MSNELVKIPNLIPMSIKDVMQRKAEVAKIQHDLMKPADFEKGISGHYGIIPGTNQNSLLKAGAELLCMVFRLAPKYEIIQTDLPGEHREYETKCSLYQIGTNVFMGEGIGTCTTMETKYRWRTSKGEGEDTGRVLPGQYWGERKKKTKEGDIKALNMLGGYGFFPKKLENGQWKIFKKTKGTKILNPNPADEYNTVKKQSKKRSLIDVVLTVLAVSDMFIQDQYEKIIEKIESGEYIDVPWQDIHEGQEKEETKNFGPTSFSNGNTSTSSPEKKPDVQKPDEKKKASPKAKSPATKTTATRSQENGEKKTGDDKESPQSIRDRVVSFISGNPSLHDEIAGLLSVAMDSNNMAYTDITNFLNLSMISDSDIIPDKYVAVIDQALKEGNYYK